MILLIGFKSTRCLGVLDLLGVSRILLAATAWLLDLSLDIVPRIPYMLQIAISISNRPSPNYTEA